MSGREVDGGRTAAPGQDSDGRKVGKLPWIVDKDLAIRDANGFVIAKPNLNLPEEELERMAAFIAGAANATAGGPCNPAKLRVALEKTATWANEDGCECCVAQREQMAKEALEEAGKVDGETSDGYHTFNELYHHRAVLFSVIVHCFRDLAWKSRLHADGTMYEGYFIVGVTTPRGEATYHYSLDPYWDMFDCVEIERAPEWDGHTPADAIERIRWLAAMPAVRRAAKMREALAWCISAIGRTRGVLCVMGWIADRCKQCDFENLCRACDAAEKALAFAPFRNCDCDREVAEDAYTAEFGRPWTEEEARLAAWLFAEAERPAPHRQDADGRAT